MGNAGAQKALIGGADTSRPDRELWQSAGSLASTSRVKDIASHSGSSLPSRAIAAGPNGYFAAYTAATGFELHATRGTPATTALVADLRPGPGSALSASDGAAEGVLEGIGLGALLLFMADTQAAGNELHVSDGSPAGTRLLADLSTGSVGSQAHAFAVAGSRAFVLLGTEVFGGGPNPQTLLVASGGTPAGTAPLSLGCVPDAGGGLRAIGALVYFLCEDAAFGRELHRVDSATLASTRVTDLATGPDSASIQLLGRIGQPARLLFAETSGDTRLFATDGTPASTLLIHTAAPAQGFDSIAWPDVAGNAWLRGQADGQSAVFRLAAAAPHALSTVFTYTPGAAAPDGDLPARRTGRLLSQARRRWGGPGTWRRRGAAGPPGLLSSTPAPARASGCRRGARRGAGRDRRKRRSGIDAVGLPQHPGPRGELRHRTRRRFQLPASAGDAGKTIAVQRPHRSQRTRALRAAGTRPDLQRRLQPRLRASALRRSERSLLALRAA